MTLASPLPPPCRSLPFRRLVLTALLTASVAVTALAAPPARPHAGSSTVTAASRVPTAAAGEERFTFAPFGTVHVYVPPRAPEQVVLFLSGDGGWNLGVVPMARRLQAEGALVVGIDVRSLAAGLGREGPCAYLAGSLEELSRAAQLRGHLPQYHAPILVGYSSGATLVYAALAQAPAETFRGAISLGFCSDVELPRPLCRGRGLESGPLPKGVGSDLRPFAALGVPWTVLQGEIDQVCAPAATERFVAEVAGANLVRLPKVGHGFSVAPHWEPQYVGAYRSLAAPALGQASAPAAAAPQGGDVSDLGVIELPAAGGPSDTMAVLLSGDGGWAGIDKAVATRLAAEGVPVVGWSSLKYYWTPRTPDAAAADLARLLEHYATVWGSRRVLIAGYSFGADVLPFLVSRLPSHLRSRIELVALLGLSSHAAFEFHVSDWLGGDRGEYATAPEVARLAPTRVLCFEGEDEAESACGAPRPPSFQVERLPGGHHFGGDYGRIAEAILAAVGRRPARSGS
jgi:type IV secretory pathway VirJ component